MELSRGILRRMLSCVLCVLLLGTCTGCNVADKLRPDLNLHGDLRILLIEGGGDGSGNNSEGEPGGPVVTPGKESNVVSTWPGGSPNTGKFEYKNPNRDQDASVFVGTKAAMIEATDYGTYLQQQVYQKLLQQISVLDDDVKNKLYIRVCHTGYDLQRKDQMKKVAGYSAITSGRVISNAQVVGGGSLITLADDWVGGLDINSSHKDSQVSYAQSSIKSYVSADDFQKDWYQLSESKLPAIYYKMMGRDSASFSNLQSYYDAIASDPFHNIPNYNLYYYTGVNTTNKMTFNKVSGSVMDRYVDGVPTTTVDKLCGTYNQYITRERDAVTNVVQDNDSILKYNIDGYNKTIIFVATTAGGNLKDTVGDTVYRQLLSTVSNAYVCTDVNQIKAITYTELDDQTGATVTTLDYSNFTVIPAGSKGVD